MLKDTWWVWGGALCSRGQGHIRFSLFLQSQQVWVAKLKQVLQCSVFELEAIEKKNTVLNSR